MEIAGGPVPPKTKLRMKFLAKRLQLFKGFWPAHAPLIFTDPIVTFVKPTNQNAGFTINV